MVSLTKREFLLDICLQCRSVTFKVRESLLFGGYLGFFCSSVVVLDAALWAIFLPRPCFLDVYFHKFLETDEIVSPVAFFEVWRFDKLESFAAVSISEAFIQSLSNTTQRQCSLTNLLGGVFRVTCCIPWMLREDSASFNIRINTCSWREVSLYFPLCFQASSQGNSRVNPIRRSLITSPFSLSAGGITHGGHESYQQSG